MRVILVCLGLCGIAYSAASYTYETDVHYGLSYWLARKIGFEHREAHEIARANQRTDLGLISATHMMLLATCAGHGGNVEDASRDVRDRHFRSNESVPKHPRYRPVTAAGKYAMQEISARAKDTSEANDQFYSFGRAMHGFQDSYSHQGEASTLIACPDDWVWSHPRIGTPPQAWGGPDSHEPDFTYKRREVAIEMAKRTYEYLLEFRKHRMKNHASAAVGWDSLEGDVRRFVEASTKTNKERWLEEQGVPQARSIAAGTNLPPGGKGFDYYRSAPRLNLVGEHGPTQAEAGESQKARVMIAIFQQFRSKNSAPTSVTKEFEKFFSVWFSGSPRVRDFVPQRPSVNGTPVDPTVFLRVLNVMLSADHGTASAARHGLAPSEETSKPVRFDDWRKMLRPLYGEPFFVAKTTTPGPLEGEYVAFLRLIQAPHDLVLVSMQESSGNWEVRDLTIVVVH